MPTNPLKTFIWDASFAGNLKADPYVAVVIPPDEVKMELQELVRISLINSNTNQLTDAGMALVTSIKTCRIEDLDPMDVTRLLGTMKTKKGILNQMEHSSKKQGWSLHSEIQVITLKQNNYDLKPLNNWLQKRTKGIK